MAKFENLFLWSRAKFKKDPQVDKNKQAIEKNRVSIETNKNDITQIRQELQTESGNVAQNQADINLLKQADTDLQVAMSSKADNNQVVNLNGDQQIMGVKTFRNTPVMFLGLNMSAERIQNVGTPVSNTDAATKEYVDNNSKRKVVAHSFTTGPAAFAYSFDVVAHGRYSDISNIWFVKVERDGSYTILNNANISIDTSHNITITNLTPGTSYIANVMF